MNPTQLVAAPHVEKLLLARQQFFDDGQLADGLVDPVVSRSWTRCSRFGLSATDQHSYIDSMDRVALKTEQHRNRLLLSQGRPIMEYVYEQIRDSGSMVILADANGLLLDTVGDPDFVDRADRVALLAGASWDENQCGTNAIGTALVEECPVAILGAEHYLSRNGFLTCCASPIFGPDGRLLGVLDISGDYRSYQRHTLGLARFSAGILERRLFESVHARDIVVSFHANPDCLGSPREGLAAISPDGEVLAVNRLGLDILGIRQVDAVRRDFGMVFENTLASLVDRCRLDPLTPLVLNVNGRQIHLRLRGQLPHTPVAGRIFDERTTSRPLARKPEANSARPTCPEAGKSTLDTLNTGDPRLQIAIDRARKVLGRDIPIMIQGESGAGKEVFAKAFHQSGNRRDASFVALNCAAIPETLIEAELFGYQGGAFTGSRKEGAPGKIQLADGGTLFLDEIGDMPLALQARLLRVLQERSITPLGSARAIPVDISLICATHRNLREEVARGNFREDLYYRLNGLCVTLPALRERTDLRALAEKFAAEESRQRPLPVRFSTAALERMAAYPWPGNIRQMVNVVRVAIAMLEDDESLIQESHLPDEILDDIRPVTTASSPPTAATPAGSMADIERQAALVAMQEAGGNISAAARRLGISRNTLYRKLGRG